MNITMEIKDEEFIKAINGAVEDIPQEVKIELVTEALRGYLSKPEVMRQVLFIERSNSYSYKVEYIPNDILKGLMESGPIKDHLDEIQNTMLTYILENMQELMIKSFTSAIANSLMPHYFTESIASSMNEAIMRHEHNNHQ